MGKLLVLAICCSMLAVARAHHADIDRNLLSFQDRPKPGHIEALKDNYVKQLFSQLLGRKSSASTRKVSLRIEPPKIVTLSRLEHPNTPASAPVPEMQEAFLLHRELQSRLGWGGDDNANNGNKNQYGPPQGFSQPSQQYGAPPAPPNQQYGPPPNQQYGPPPAPPNQQYGPPPAPPNQQYGPPPAPPNQQYGPPPAPPNQQYGPPPAPPNQQYGPPPASPNEQYGPPAQPNQQYGPPPPPPNEQYGAPPAPPSQQYGPPAAPPNQQYGPPPAAPNEQYSPPAQPNQQYGPPPPPPNQQYGPPSQPNQQYGPPQSPPNQQYGAPPAPPNEQYGPPAQPNQQYGPPPSPPKEQYGPPAQPNQQYGPPSQPNQQYGPPSQEYGPPPSNNVDSGKNHIRVNQGTFGGHVENFKLSDAITKNNNNGYSPPPQNQYGPPSNDISNFKDDSNAKIFKHVYIHTPPEEPEVQQKPRVIRPNKKQDTHYQIIFVKSPTPVQEAPTEIELPSPPERKTLVYVLVKKPGRPAEIKFKAPPPTQPAKPEVYFIRYKGNQKNGDGGYAGGGGQDQSSNLKSISDFGVGTSIKANDGYSNLLDTQLQSHGGSISLDAPIGSNNVRDSVGYPNTEYRAPPNMLNPNQEPMSIAVYDRVRNSVTPTNTRENSLDSAASDISVLVAKRRHGSHYTAPGSKPFERASGKMVDGEYIGMTSNRRRYFLDSMLEE